MATILRLFEALNLVAETVTYPSAFPVRSLTVAVLNRAGDKPRRYMDPARALGSD